MIELPTSYAVAVIDDQHLTNGAYGFPRAHARSLIPRVLAVVHITANMADAKHQRDYANRPGSPGPSAHYYIDRNGDGIRAVDPAQFAAWSNGDLKAPRLTNAGVRYLNALPSVGRNPNEGCYLEIECVGEANPAGQWTDAQFATVARLIADASGVTNLRIAADTVLPHSYLNSIDRAHCPSLDPAVHMSRLIALAKGIADVTPAPITDETPDKQVTVAKGAKLYDLDGSTLLSTLTTALDWRTSPYGTASKRAIYAEINGLRRLVLTTPSATRTNAPDCSQEVTDAIKADRAKAKIAITYA